MAAPPTRPHAVSRQGSSFLDWSRSAIRVPSASTNEWSWTEDAEDDTWDSGSDHDESQSKKGLSNRIGAGLKLRTPSESPSTSTLALNTTTASPIPLANGRPSANARHIPIAVRRQPSFSSNGSHAVPEHGSTSSGAVSFSFTHLDAPSPSSYPRDNFPPSPIPARPSLPSSGLASSRGQSSKPLDESDARKAAGWTIVSVDEAAANRLARDRRQRSESGRVPEENDDGEPEVHIVPTEPDLELEDLELEDRLSVHKRIGVGSEAITLYVEDIVKGEQDTHHSDARSDQDAVAANALSPTLTPAATMSSDGSLSQSRIVEKADAKLVKFENCLLQEDVDMATLRKLSWSGIPISHRPAAWPLLLGYLPLSSSARSAAVTRKRMEYQRLVEVTFQRGKDGLDQQIWHQIEIDVPRTRPGVRLWMMEGTQRSLERILYVWAIRHPASGYVQGINDLVTPFYQVFLSTYIDADPEDFDPSVLPQHVLSAVEADSFWCLSRLLDGIQDNYIHNQPGIQRSVKRMRELVGRIDPPLAAHLDAQGVEFMQFAFRWMNCLLMREISVKNTVRMWDTYLSEGTDAFSQFHLYVCSAFLINWSDRLREMDFQGIIMFLQSLPTEAWTDHEIEMLLSQAFVLCNTWANAQSHFS